ncbi:DNA-3-methyladenine glycosylase I [Arcicella aurantiaca]|uniref:DNA-3-methyladenine glycosylase I n=1 Tax=Arcicella aurantiaca TaxID=591202 RepID=A0A316EAH5_9BACT|nr:DNA-3-methyladenine glycosylase I [Arcicella aurantiaca]PWK27455.1 DNA-3-methyladenine glycosylase I [Arcicella aurantiaca]
MTIKKENITRCQWAGNDELYIKYHDEEWGVPLYDDDKLFEFLILEGFQAGLSWITILRKRESFRKAFDNFEALKIVKYDAQKVEELMQDAGIIRNRLKIEGTITNARIFLEIQQEYGSFREYIWQFVGGQPIVNQRSSLGSVPARTDISDAMSKTLKKRGFKFIGTTICYAFMQATGMVNDHIVNCICYNR